MKFTIAVALCCCAAQVFGLGMPNPLMPQTTFSTVPPWQYNPTSTGLAFQTTTFVVPPSFTQTAKQYRRVYDWQNVVAYTPLNNYVLLSNADFSGMTPRAKVHALGPTVTQLTATNIGDTVAHRALSVDAFGNNLQQLTAQYNNWVVDPWSCYAWTGGSLDWNMFILSGYDQVFDTHLPGSILNQADQDVTGVKTAVQPVPDQTVDVFNPLAPNPFDVNFWPQTFIRSSPQSDGLYFCKDSQLLGTVSVQNGDQSLFFKDRKTHQAYGGYRPNHLLNSGCDRQNYQTPGQPPAFFGNCP